MQMPRLFCALLLGTAALSAQGVDWIRANYQKQEFQIQMRDGVHLFTTVYSPKDRSHAYPILLTRTPYGSAPYGDTEYPGRIGPSVTLARAGYVFVVQDVRGRFKSEGKFIEMRPQLTAHSAPQDIDESTDTYDTVDWLVHNIPNNNGRVGLTGTSYPGFYAAAGLLCGHPALRAVSPQAPMVDLFLGDDFSHNGAFFLAANFGFYWFFQQQKNPQLPNPEPRFEYGTPDGYSFYLSMGPVFNAETRYYKSSNPYFSDLLKHTSYDEFWKSRSLIPHLHDVNPAVLAVGGWYDTEDPQGVFRLYDNASRRNPKSPVSIVIGPWFHGGWHASDGAHLGPIEFGQKTSEYFKENIEAPFFEKWLRDGADPELPAASMFQTGANVWRQFRAWPPPQARKETIYLRENGGLAFEAPSKPEGYDQYVSDPAKPVPYTSFITIGMAGEYMTEDQRFADRRPDVLTYETAPLDHDLTLAGPVGVRLEASTSGTDSDWVVKLIDVYPSDAPPPSPNPKALEMGGYEQLVRGEPFRGRFWKSFEEPAPLPRDQFVAIKYDLPDIFHTFRKGHRVMVQVQSSWFPLIDRNPQTFVPNIPDAKSADFVPATQRIGRSAKHPSRLEILVLE